MSMSHHKAGVLSRILRYNSLLDESFKYFKQTKEQEAQAKLVESLSAQFYYEQQGAFIEQKT